MKTFVGYFWRYRNQFDTSGYETARTVEAMTITSATKKFEKNYEDCLRGSMKLLRVELVG